VPAEIVPPIIDWRAKYAEQQRCELEAHPHAHWHQRVFDNGSVHIEFYCPDCDTPVTRERYGTPGAWVSAEWFAEHVTAVSGLKPDELELHRRSHRYHLCYLCNATSQCEFHHVAPQALYGKAAEKYPIVPLCKPCHDRETKDFTDRLERYVQERIRRFLSKQGGVGA
jgi:hypothetical protein